MTSPQTFFSKNQNGFSLLSIFIIYTLMKARKQLLEHKKESSKLLDAKRKLWSAIAMPINTLSENLLNLASVNLVISKIHSSLEFLSNLI